jgi:general stress protein 26
MSKKLTLATVSEKMRKLDICMLTTKTSRGLVTSRPMSNNGDVEYDGNSWFFTFDKTRTVKDISENPQVNLGFNGPKDLFISLTGKAKLVKNKATMAEHWLDELNRWFPQGLETPGIIMIHVKAKRIKFWQREEEGEIKL